MERVEGEMILSVSIFNSRYHLYAFSTMSFLTDCLHTFNMLCCFIFTVYI